ncbi:MAG: DUF2062 domain-containing protein [Bdellovibrio sp.]|nr:DUF2062 domain-containing protein [Bdellovibrio sp.]
MFKKVRELFLVQVRQGATPEGLALTCAVGFTIAVFPVLGVTTVLCLLVGQIMRLNQPVLQTVNYALAPLQLLMIPLYLKLGAWIFQVPAVSINPLTMVEEFMDSPQTFLQEYWVASLQSLVAWAVVTPVATVGVYFVTRTVFQGYQKLRKGEG